MHPLRMVFQVWECFVLVLVMYFCVRSFAQGACELLSSLQAILVSKAKFLDFTFQSPNPPLFFPVLIVSQFGVCGTPYKISLYFVSGTKYFCGKEGILHDMTRNTCKSG